jgi:AraC-like DNA-binding protein
MADPDLISDVLTSFGFRAHVYSSPQVCGPWQINTTGMHRASFHLVSRGACWLHLRNQPPQPLRSGDLAVFPSDAWHLLSAEADPAEDLDTTRVYTDQSGPTTNLVCGYFEFAHGYDNPLLGSLPDCILVRDPADTARMGQIVDLLGDEAARDLPGRQAILDHLSDALFVMVLRHYLAESRPSRGWLTAAADPSIGRALGAIHREPGRPWQLVDLAGRAGLSRTAFVERFTRMVGQPPMSYLTGWRMQQAARLLTDPTLSVETIAERMGYDTTAAFRRAFKRETGKPPGALRPRPAGRANIQDARP